MDIRRLIFIKASIQTLDSVNIGIIQNIGFTDNSRLKGIRLKVDFEALLYLGNIFCER